ncbi:MAG: hypothetical protein WA840_22755 [Caulobacteraceae bacterium]
MSLFSTDDVAEFRQDALLAAYQAYLPGVTYSDAYLLRQLQAAEAETAKVLRVFLEPTYVFPHLPRADEIAALPTGMPWAEEPGYDYGPGFFESDSWGYLVLQQKPLIEVHSIVLDYPAPTQGMFAIPRDWIRPDRKYATIRLVPGTSSFVAPLGAFVLQALGGGSTIPSMIRVTYTAGLTGVKTDPHWADLLDAIYKKAVLKVIEGAFLPQSGSIGADGLSQSLSINTQQYRDQAAEILTGPKGSNGGLRAYIHGVGGTMLGVLA